MSFHQTHASGFSGPEPFYGFVATTIDAFRLVLAARQGVIPRITRRLNDAERRSMIKSGAVFVFDVEESGIKRWTEGRMWSPSRIVGNFLVYREIIEHGHSRNRKNQEHKSIVPSQAAPLITGGSVSEFLPGGNTGYVDFSLEDTADERGTLKPDGLIKKTITVAIDGSDLHLIAYYTQKDVQSGHLEGTASRSDIMALVVHPPHFRLTSLRVPLKVQMGSDGQSSFASETNNFDHLEFPVESPWLTREPAIGETTMSKRCLVSKRRASESPSLSEDCDEGTQRDISLIGRPSLSVIRSSRPSTVHPPSQTDKDNRAFPEYRSRTNIAEPNPPPGRWPLLPPPQPDLSQTSSSRPMCDLVVHRSHLQYNYAPPNPPLAASATYHRGTPKTSVSYPSHYIPGGLHIPGQPEFHGPPWSQITDGTPSGVRGWETGNQDGPISSVIAENMNISGGSREFGGSHFPSDLCSDARPKHIHYLPASSQANDHSVSGFHAVPPEVHSIPGFKSLLQSQNGNGSYHRS